MTQSTSALYFRAVFSSKLPVMVCSEHRFSTFWLVYFQILLLYHISTISRNVEILKLKFVNSRSAKLSFKFSIHQFSFSNTFICLLSIDFCLSTSLSLLLLLFSMANVLYFFLSSGHWFLQPFCVQKIFDDF